MINDSLNKYPIISDQISKNELEIILNSLQSVIEKDTTGDIIEMGCYVGTTSLFISRLLNAMKSNKEFHVYDSFEGLPEKSPKDSSPAGEQFIAGELKASKKLFIENYKKAGLNLPTIHKSWFNNLEDSNIPENIAFAFLDGDYYDSIQTCLKLIDKKLSKNSVVIVDDYQNEALPGARKAVDEWLAYTGYRLKIEQSLAIITVTK